MELQETYSSMMNEEKGDEFRLSELNTQMLREMLDTEEVEKISHKVNEKKCITFSQVEEQETSSLHEEQSKVIKELVRKNEEISVLAESESKMRANLFLNLEHVKEKINTFKTLYNMVKETIERTTESKIFTDTKFKNLRHKYDLIINEENSAKKELQLNIEKIMLQLKYEQKNFTDFKENALQIQNDKDEYIIKLKNDLNTLNKLKQEEYKQQLEEINSLIQQKESLIEMENIYKAKQELFINELNKEIASLKEEITKLQTLQLADKESIENLKKNCADVEELLKIEKENVKNLESQNKELNKLIHELEQQHDQYIKRICELETMLQNEIQAKQNEQNIYQHDLTETRNIIDNMTADFNNITTKLKNSEDETELLKNSIKSLTEKNYDLETTMQKSINDYETKLSSLSEQNKILQTEISTRDQELEDMKSKYTVQEEKYSSNQKKLQNRYDDVFIEKENLLTAVERLKEEKEEMRTDYSKKLSEIKKESNKKIKEIHLENEKIINNLEDDIQNYKNEKMILKEANTKLELKINEITVAKKNLENELNQKLKETEHLVSVQEKVEKSLQQEKVSPPSDKSDNMSDYVSQCPVKKPSKSFGWFDDSSDSSFDADYPVKKPKLIMKRKSNTQAPRGKNEDKDELFDSLRGGDSMFRQPKQPTRKSRAPKTVF